MVCLELWVRLVWEDDCVPVAKQAEKEGLEEPGKCVDGNQCTCGARGLSLLRSTGRRSEYMLQAATEPGYLAAFFPEKL